MNLNRIQILKKKVLGNFLGWGGGGDGWGEG